MKQQLRDMKQQLRDDLQWIRENAEEYRKNVCAKTPVGVFLCGDTPEGLADVSGNVGEWTNSVVGQYPYVADDGREDAGQADTRLVVRGGSWATPVTTRAAPTAAPTIQASGAKSLGLRLVCFSPIL